VISLRLGLRGSGAEPCTLRRLARIGIRADRPTPTAKWMFAEDLLRRKICTYRLDHGFFIDAFRCTHCTALQAFGVWCKRATMQRQIAVPPHGIGYPRSRHRGGRWQPLTPFRITQGDSYFVGTVTVP
jgi:hypothetical protein